MTITILVEEMVVVQHAQLRLIMFVLEVLQQRRILELLEELDFIKTQLNLLEKLIEETD